MAVLTWFLLRDKRSFLFMVVSGMGIKGATEREFRSLTANIGSARLSAIESVIALSDDCF